MGDDSNGRRETAIDFATKTVFGDPVTTEEKSEVIETLRELIAFFGSAPILRAIGDLGLTSDRAEF